MKYILQQADIPNRNGRIYPKHLLEKEIKHWNDTYVKERRAFVSKECGFINLKDIVGLITEMKMEDNKVVIDVECLSGIPNADEIFKLVEQGKLFPRMSGLGTLIEQSDGTKVVGDDYELISIFLTDKPA
jgi:hypothetical protein